MNSYTKLFILLLILWFVYGCNNDGTKIENKKEIPETIKKMEPKLDSVIKKDTIVILRDENQTYGQAYDKALTLWQIPFIEKSVKTSFGNAHVIISGPENGEPLILLHGMNASSTMWYPNIKSLSQSYRVYAIDFLLEPGKSLYNGEISETSQIVSWYYEIFDQLNLKKFSLVGASRGGWLSVNIALHSKSRINKLILLSPAQTFVWIKLGFKMINNIEYSILPKRKRLRNVMETMTYNVDNISQLYINQYYLATKIATINKCFMQMRPFSETQLKSLNVPILVLIGDQDIINNNKILNKRILDFLNLKSNLTLSKKTR
jgi:pimeloyl-ACP methyl ester carboxylesterase